MADEALPPNASEYGQIRVLNQHEALLRGSPPGSGSGGLSGRLDTVEAARIRSITDATGILLGADPTGVANSAAVIQAHLDSGDHVYTPEGTFKLGTTGVTLSHDDQAFFGGLDVLARTFVYSGSGAAISNAAPGTLLQNGALYGFQIDTRTAGAGHRAVEMQNFLRWRVGPLRLNGTGAAGTGLKLIGTASRFVYLCTFEGLQITAGSVDLDITDNCNGNTFENGVLDGSGINTRIARTTTDSGTNTFDRVAYQGSGAVAVSLGAGCSDNRWQDCRMEPGVGAQSIEIAAGAVRNSIVGGSQTATLTINDAAVGTNATLLILPSVGVFKIGQVNAGAPKRTLDLLSANAGITFGNDALCNWYRRTAGYLHTDAAIESAASLQTYQGGVTSVFVSDSGVMALGSGTNQTLYIDSKGSGVLQLNGANGATGGTRVEAAGGKVGFYGTAPIAKQTGVAVTAAGIHAALVALGLISA
jgi:hypothetical protein